MTRWRPMLRWEACKERCEEGRRGGRLEEEEKRREGGKLSDEAVEKLGGGGSTSNTLTKGKIGRERIYYVYGLFNSIVYFRHTFGPYHIIICHNTIEKCKSNI